MILAIQKNDPVKVMEALNTGALVLGTNDKGVPWPRYALEHGSDRALKALLINGANVWDEYGGRPLWAHAFDLAVPTCIHRVLCEDPRLQSSSAHSSALSATPVSILLWKRHTQVEGSEGDDNLNIAENALAQRPYAWTVDTWVYALGQAIRSKRESHHSLPRLDALGCGLSGATSDVKRRIVVDTAHLAQWEAPEGEAVACRATEWLLHFANAPDVFMAILAREERGRLLSIVPPSLSPAIAPRMTRLRSDELGRHLEKELPVGRVSGSGPRL